MLRRDAESAWVDAIGIDARRVEVWGLDFDGQGLAGTSVGLPMLPPRANDRGPLLTSVGGY